MRRPRIGVTLDEGETGGPVPLPRHELKKGYSEAVLAAGGLPLLLAPSADEDVIADYLTLCDGLLVTGGAFDVPPELYGEAPRDGLGALRPARTAFEARFVREALGSDIPLLGICGGMQLLNVVAGGSLFQDIAREIPGAAAHEQDHDRRQPHHAITVTAGTALARAMGAGPHSVNSTHHQAVSRVGAGLVVSAIAPDGVIEAIESTRHRFAVGVQWHPELLIASSPPDLAIYRDFADAARGRAELTREE